jgi:hypothetical protein
VRETTDVTKIEPTTEPTNEPTNEPTRVAQLEAEIAELRSLLHQVVAAIQPSPAEPTASPEIWASIDAAVARTEPSRSSRRGMLRLAGAAAAGTAAAVAANALPAAAADLDPLRVGELATTTPTTRLTTGLIYENSSRPQVSYLTASTDANIFVVRDNPSGTILFNPSSSSYPSAVAGYGYTVLPHGVYGFTQNDGYGIVGNGAGAGSRGALMRGLKCNVELFSAGNAPASRTDAHAKGELIEDVDGNLWVCVVTGSPGTWRKVAGPATAGAFHAVTPFRVYDSRAGQPLAGPIANGQNRSVSVADSRDLNTGVVITANAVPAGATAISCNLTVVNTLGGGFLTINPGGVTTPGAASVNWTAAGQVLNNGIIAAINATSRQVTIVCGGGTGARTDVVLDVTGYYL